MFLVTLIPLPIADPVYAFAVLLIILLVAPLMAKALRVPPLILLILLGCLLGLNGLGILARDPQLIFLEKVGLLYIMLLAGIQMDLSNLQRLGMRSLLFGLLTFGIPFMIGGLCGYGMIQTGMITIPGSLSIWLAMGLLGILFSPHTLIAYPSMIRLGIAQQEAVGVAVGGTVVTSVLTLVLLSVIQASVMGEVSLWLWLKLLVGLPLVVGLMFAGMPRLGQLLLGAKTSTPLNLQFVFVLMTLFVTAAFTQLLGLDAIVGAFIAGLALNRFIPVSSDLMNRIEFVGNSLFIPAFMVSVGVLANPKIFVTAPQSMGVAAVIILGAVAAKFMGAWLASQAFHYSGLEMITLFSLTVPRAALVLVIVLFGKQANLVDDNVFNAVIAYIVVTCICGPALSEIFGQRLAQAKTG
ncbi:MAG: cation:proton antiporter [Acaryochloridaceae cyanobacterium SU_2_1]|nr:cation:proton antiporter [Acaryochloridaceae cyanobacterium SU_2_1]